MAPLDTVDAAEAQAAAATLVVRIAALIRSIRNPTAPAIGEWSVRDVAVHLGHVWQGLPAMARRQTAPPLRDLWELGAMTTALVRGERDPEPEAVAGRIEKAAREYLAETAVADDGGTTPWMIEGIEVPRSVFTCHLINEMLLHGDDIARAERRPWRIEPVHAGLALRGFILPVVRLMDPCTLVDQARTGGFAARWDVSWRGQGRVVYVLEGGELHLEAPAGRRVDCRISADPGAFLLVMFGRRGVWSTVARGRMLAWGRRPWLLPTLRALTRNP